MTSLIIYSLSLFVGGMSVGALIILHTLTRKALNGWRETIVMLDEAHQLLEKITKFAEQDEKGTI